MRLLKPVRTGAIVMIAMCLSAMVATADEKATAESKQKLSIPGKFIRIAVTDDGWVTLGYLDVQFANSMVKVPFEIMTKEREKEFEKIMKEAKKK